MNRMLLVVAFGAPAILIQATPVLAQATGGNMAEAGAGFVGAGILATNDDTPNRIRFPLRGESSSPLFVVQGTVFVTERIGLGAEFSPRRTVSGRTDTACCIFQDLEEERVWLGTVRGRVARGSHLALDLVGGIGILFQHRETDNGLRFPASDLTVVEDRRSPAFALGIDLPWGVARHIALIPQMRVRFLERGDLDAASVFRTSSRTLDVGITAGLVW